MVAPRSRGPCRQARVLDVAHHRLALVVLDLVLAALGRDVDRRAVQGGADLAAQEGAVVVGVVPGQAAFVARVLPERRHELHGVHRALAVERRLAALVGLHAPVVPQERIGPCGRVTEGVPERLPVRVTVLLELRGDLAQILVRLRERRDADLVEPRLPVGDQAGHDRVREREEFTADLRVLLGLPVEAALLLGLPLRDVGHVDEAVFIEVRPVVEHVNDVGAALRLDRRRDARLQIVGVDELEHYLRAERLPRLAGLLLQLDVAGRDEIDPAQDVQPRALRERRRAAGRRHRRRRGRGLHERAPGDPSCRHAQPS